SLETTTGGAPWAAPRRPRPPPTTPPRLQARSVEDRAPTRRTTVASPPPHSVQPRQEPRPPDHPEDGRDNGHDPKTGNDVRTAPRSAFPPRMKKRKNGSAGQMVRGASLRRRC